MHSNGTSLPFMTSLKPLNNITCQDMLGRTIHLPSHSSLRIISLVPSQTELLVDLGLSTQLVGITKFCIHPDEIYQSKPRVGGTKQIDFEKIRSLKPDIIIANKEENEKNQIIQLAEEFPVWISDIYTLADNNQMILQLGQIFNQTTRAKEIINFINQGFSNIESLKNSLSVAYFIWRKPFMVTGNDTFINHILLRLGFTNIYQNRIDSRYPEISLEQMNKQAPDVALLSSEPYPFSDKHIQELQTVWPNTLIKLVDGELFSWYGSRLIHAPAYFNALISKLNNHPFYNPN